MALMTARRKVHMVHLREEARGLGSGGPARVDRARGIIFGVKILGRTSPNRHGTNATEGTEYTAEAIRKAAPLYEGAKVNLDHPPKDRPGRDRSAADRLGKIVNVEVRADGLYGDLHCLKSHPMANRVLEAAVSMPDTFALSHNAYGRGEVVNGKYIVTEIPEVRSVDLVADGGTNTSLFEGRGTRRRVPPSTLPPLTLRDVAVAMGSAAPLRPASTAAERQARRQLQEALGRPPRRRTIGGPLTLHQVGVALGNH